MIGTYNNFAHCQCFSCGGTHYICGAWIQKDFVTEIETWKKNLKCSNTNRDDNLEANHICGAWIQKDFIAERQQQKKKEKILIDLECF